MRGSNDVKNMKERKIIVWNLTLLQKQHICLSKFESYYFIKIILNYILHSQNYFNRKKPTCFVCIKKSG